MKNRFQSTGKEEKSTKMNFLFLVTEIINQEIDMIFQKFNFENLFKF